MYFSLDSVPNEQLTLGGAWMDYSDKENSPGPAQLKCFGPVEGDSVLPMGLPDSIASLVTELSIFIPGARRTVCGSHSLQLLPASWLPGHALFLFTMHRFANALHFMCCTCFACAVHVHVHVTANS